MQALLFIEAHGKAEAWTRIADSLRKPIKVVATGGHVCRFPGTLFPIGISLSGRGVIDPSRRPEPKLRERILNALINTPQGTQIIIATDDDVEGDVIALDIADIIYASDRSRMEDIFRLRPGAINKDGVRRAFANMTPLSSGIQDLVDDSIQGRARAVTDRWIGATFSKAANLPVGRVRSALLGASYLWNKSPKHTRGTPETGEVTLQVRSAVGGRPFQARIPFNSDLYDPRQMEILANIASKYANRFAPGVVRPLQSLSAAVAPRIGDVTCFNTGDALAYASRHHGISPKDAMRGLQDGYLNGLISYPRTESREVSADTAAYVTSLGTSCNIANLDPFHLSAPTPGAPPRKGHEALHPTFDMNVDSVTSLSKLIRRKFTDEDYISRGGVMGVMVSIVARRAFEASREITMTAGNWGQNNMITTNALSQEEIDVLCDVDWVREDLPSMPWGRDLMTGVRTWPMEAILIEGLMIEDIGRPSTFATHVETAMNSGDFLPESPGRLPSPSPQGMTSLKRTPQAIWMPSTCRKIEQILENKDDIVDDDESESLDMRVRARVLFWLKKMPKQIQDALLAALSDEGFGGLGGNTASGPSSDSNAPSEESDGSSPMDIPDMSSGPAPSWA